MVLMASSQSLATGTPAAHQKPPREPMHMEGLAQTNAHQCGQLLHAVM